MAQITQRIASRVSGTAPTEVGSSFPGSLQDGNDGTGVTGTNFFENALTASGLPTGTPINWVQCHMRGYSTNGVNHCQVFSTLAGNNRVECDTVSAAMVTVDGAQQTTKPAGGAWTVADVDALHLILQGNFWIAEVWVTVDYNAAPTATPNLAAGTEFTTDTPTVGWTYTDPEGNTESNSEIQVYRASDNTLMQDTNPGASATSVVLNRLPDDDYYYRVRALDAGSGLWGAWSANSNTFRVRVQRARMVV